MLLVLAGLGAALAQDVLINELLYNPTGTDSGNEWVELCNAGSTDVDLAGWQLQAGGTSFAALVTLPTLVIAPGERVIIGAGGSVALGGTMQNGGGATDGVRLVDAGLSVVDTVLYDTPNTNNLVDDSGGVGTEFAPAAPEGDSLARIPDCSDSDDASVDFRVDESPTPGEENVIGSGTGGGGSCATNVLINELLPNPAGSDGGQEWVELYNAGGADVDVSGWTLEYGASSYSSSKTLPEGSMITAGGYLVVGGAKAPMVDIVLDLSMGNAGTGADAVRLVCSDDTVADIVVYGGDNDEGWTDESGGIASVAPLPTEGASIGRALDGLDTDDCAADFELQEFSSPGSANGAEPPPCDGRDDIRINELLSDPEGSDGDAMAEWVELYNDGLDPVDLSGWELQFGTSSYGSSAIIPDGTTLEAGGFLVVGEANAPNVGVVVELGLGNAGSSADALRLIDCGPGVVDTVIYGTPNSDGWTDDLGGVPDSTAPAPGSDNSIQRLSDGYDTDDNGADFVEQESPTPGEPNPIVEPAVCNGGARTIKINELLPDPAGSDTQVDMEWLELYNAGNQAQRLDSWVIETATSTWGEDYVFPGGVELAPGEFLVIGNPAVPVIDLSAPGLSLGNASNAPDGVRLVDCEGSVQDTVLWGDLDDDAQDVALQDDRGFQDWGPMPDEDQTIGRTPDGADTDDSSVDIGLMTPTPGAANVADDGSGGGGGGGDGKGCGGDKSGSGGKKCATLGPLGGLEWLVLGLVAWRRRAR